MKKSLSVKLIIAVIAFILTLSMFNSAICLADGNFDLDSYNEGADAAIKDPATTIIGTIIGGVRIVCAGIAIIMIMVVAMKYIAAAPGDRADIKKSSIQYVIGALILFGGSQILTMLTNSILTILGE